MPDSFKGLSGKHKKKGVITMPVKETIENLEVKGIRKREIALRLGVHYGTVLRWANGASISTYNKGRLLNLIEKDLQKQERIFVKYYIDMAKIPDNYLVSELRRRGYAVKK